MGNTLCNGRVKNNNPNSPIDYFLLVTVREYSDYQVYGSVPIDMDGLPTTVFLGEFYSIDKARNFLYNLTGEVPQIISY